MVPQILLDMDGVLADFVGGAAQLYGKDANLVDCWDFYHKWEMTAEEFWPALGRDFWAGLPLTHECRGIVKLAEGLVGAENVCLLSSPCMTEGCMEGKMDWIKRNLPDYRRRFLFGPAKQFATARHRVLVDDSDDNVRSFVKHGGCAVMVPRPWNTDRHRPMSDVRGCLSFWHENLPL